MFVSYNWLKEYVDINLSPNELAERLTLTGTKVEGVKYLGENIDKVVVGRIDGLAKHQSSDKLWICSVSISDAADGQKFQIVTGAQNLSVGDKIPVALDGATLPGDKHINTTELRGIVSEGMLVSEEELGLEKESKGIMILPADAPMGADIKKVVGLDDWCIELEITPNRPDCLCMVGVAREIAAFTSSALRMPDTSVYESGERADSIVKVDVRAADLCPRYTARVIKGVKIGPSPAWMQERLRACGVRPINNIVDVTNYIMLEMNQPLHAFDLHTVAGPEIIVRKAVSGESMITLDGVSRQLTPEMLLICDASKPVALAGVMGGENSEVTDSTVDILLESANFNRVNIWRTSKDVKLRSEASSRYEKGLDPENTAAAADRAAALMAELGGGTVCIGRVDVYPEPLKSWTVDLRVQRVNKILGVEISKETMISILKSLGFGFSDKGDILGVDVPTFRRDVLMEADLIEEIARIYGFDAIEATYPKGETTFGGMSQAMLIEQDCKDYLVNCGFYETLTYAFVNPKSLDRIGLSSESPLRNMLKLSNPLTEEFSAMRTTLLHSLLEVAERNISRRAYDLSIFESARVYLPKESTDELPTEVRTIAGLAMGNINGIQWNRPSNEFDFYDMKGMVEGLLGIAGVTDQSKLTVRRSTNEAYHPGRSVDLLLNDYVIGVYGEIHPRVAEEYSIPKRAYAFELNLDAVIADGDRDIRFSSIPRYPEIRRDLAILVPISVPAEAVDTVIRREAGSLLESISLFDRYLGKQIPEGYQSMAYNISYRASDRTLKDEEIAEVQARVENALNVQLGAKVRS